MIAAQALDQLNGRMARYYLDKLRAAEAAYQCGYEHSTYALDVFDHEWPHIQQWQYWAAAHASTDDQIAELCMAYSQAGGELLAVRQHPQERLAWLEAGLAAAHQLGDAHAQMVHFYFLCRVHHTLGSLILAQDYAEKALGLARDLDEPLYISKILTALGNIFYTNADYDAAQTVLEQALVDGQGMDAKLEIGAALNALGTVAFAQGDYGRACDCLVEALAIYEAHGLPHQVCSVLDDLSNLTLQMGDEESTALYAERCVTLARVYGDQRQLASALGVLGNLAKARGDFEAAQDYFQESLDMARLLGRPSQEVLALLRLGTLRVQVGDLGGALANFEAAVAMPNASGFRMYRAIAFMALAQVFRLKGELGQAALKLHEGLEITLGVDSIMLKTWYLLEAALLWHERGEFETAAMWTALVDEHSTELDGEQQAAFEDLKQQLKEKLGVERFAATIEQGKLLDMDEVLRGLGSG